MLHDLHIPCSLGVPSYRSVSINRLCEEVLNLVSAILYFLSGNAFKYFSISKLCLKTEYDCKRVELFMFAYHDCL